MALDDRLLRILRAINEIGPCTVLELHRATAISRPAVHRVIESLCGQGYVERIPNNSRVRLTMNVRFLSAGFREPDWIVEAARDALVKLQHEVRWPSSLATPDKGQMVIRETTRYLSPFVFDSATVGMRLPMLKTSLGLAYLTFCDDVTRQINLRLMRTSSDPWDGVARDPHESRHLIEITARRGYALRRGGHEPRTSSVGVPILTTHGAVGALCVTFATSAIPSRQVTQLLTPLRTAAAEIGAAVHEDMSASKA